MKAKRRVMTGPGRPAGAKRGQPPRRSRPTAVPPPPRPGVERVLAPGRVVDPEGGLSPDTAEVDLTVDLGRGLVLDNPILVAAGTFGYGVEYADIVEVDRLGAICTRGTTIRPRPGNPSPRMAPTPGGLLNSVGLHDPGVDAVVDRYAATWAGWRVPVIVNVAAGSVGDYVEVVRRLEGVPGIAGIELNLSCPDVARGGSQFGLDAGASAEVTGAVRRATDLPLLVKLSPDAGDVRPIARAIADAGADALTAINTLAGLALAPSRDRPMFDAAFGGLSGPAVKPIALRVVYEAAQAVRIPVIGAGGITGIADVLDFLAVGATAVQIGTANFADPGLAVGLIDDLAGECLRQGRTTYRDLIGTALPKRPGRPSTAGVEYRP
jgi:dihydroorotate dehydrogenase (NAD+) catalytic subunit